MDLNIKKVAAYLEGNLAGFTGLKSVEKFARGQSNPTYLLKAASGTYALRRKPDGELLKSAHAVDREFRVQKALASTNVPVPKMHLLCEDPNIAGTMFYVMDFVKGQNYMDPQLQTLDNSARSHIYAQMQSCLAKLHAVDLASVGLNDYGPDGNYFERQISRWSKQYKASETQTISQMDELMVELNQREAFDDGQRTLVHGDFRIDNLIFDANNHDCLAILDWELSTTGHPYADLASYLMQLRMPQGEEGRGLQGLDRNNLGIPTEREFIEAYCDQRNISQLPDMGYFLAFGFFRMAAILQGVKKRALSGNASDPQSGLKLGAYIDEFAKRGLMALSKDHE